MCGINGVFAYRSGGGVNIEALRKTRDHMTARGPDGFGEWADHELGVGFGHRRLSIIDLSEGGAQPMASADGSVVVTFNGEIYNFLELRRELEGQGCVFRSHSDTEVLLHLYQRHGADMVSRLRGMFAFGLWDNRRKTLLLARDPYGIKPLYYADDGAAVRFASSVKALIAGGEVSTAPDPAGVAGYFIFGSVPEPWTTYKAIKSLRAGSYLTIERGGARRERVYFSLAETYQAAAAKAPAQGEFAESFRASALDSVRHHLIADVPVGAFLSAGVDSGALVGLMRDAGQSDVKTVTLAFEAFKGRHEDESPLAARVAAHYGAGHTTRWVGEQEFRDDLPRIIAAMDQPSIDGVNTWFVSKATRELGLKVAVSGVGGDELTGGYSTFKRIPELTRRLRFLPMLAGSETLLAGAARLARRLGLPAHPKAAGLLAYGKTFPGAYLLQRSVFVPSELADAIADPKAAAAGLAELRPLDMLASALNPCPASDFGKVAALESGFYLRNQLLRDTDWAGMAHSVEIRTPLVDSELLTRAAPVFARQSPPDGKTLLARSPLRPLPDDILNRAKTGFTTPVRDWLASASHEPANSHAKWERRLWSRDWLKYVAGMNGLDRGRAS